MSINWTNFLAGNEMGKIATFVISNFVVLRSTALVPSLLVLNCATAAYLAGRKKDFLTTHLSH